MSYAGIVKSGETSHKVAATLFGVCSVNANVQEKTVDLDDCDALLDGMSVTVRFTNGNTAAEPTLNIESLGAKSIYLTGSQKAGAGVRLSWTAGSVVQFVYDETNDRFYLVGAMDYSGIYPVGSIYLSVNSTNPADLFGGTWERIQDTFLLAAGSTYQAGSNGGEATHTLTANEMPSHTHTAKKDMASNFQMSASAQIGTGAGRVAAATNRELTIGTDVMNNTGGGAAHNNMPPYLAVYVWKRTA